MRIGGSGRGGEGRWSGLFEGVGYQKSVWWAFAAGGGGEEGMKQQRGGWRNCLS
jgi:hypothetical protein